MISEKDKEFVVYWEKVRVSENTFASKISRGLPMAFLFGLPIILSVIVVRLFAPEWYMKMSATSPGAFITILIAMMIIIVFYAYFRMQYKWEMNEQLYNEIKAKQNKTQTLN
jgi:ABC-type multidrug transport system permease subunit